MEQLAIKGGHAALGHASIFHPPSRIAALVELPVRAVPPVATEIAPHWQPMNPTVVDVASHAPQGSSVVLVAARTAPLTGTTAEVAGINAIKTKRAATAPVSTFQRRMAIVVPAETVAGRAVRVVREDA